MSDIHSHDEINAEDIDARAGAWLERQDREDWCEADKAALDQWLTQSIGHRVAYWRLKAAWNRTERLSVLRANPPSESMPRGKFWTLLGRSAAIVCVAVIASAGFYFYPRTNSWTYSTPLGGHETVRLSDGSQIELNTDTVLRVANDASARKIWLDKGEAFFQIRHDANHPFTVIARNHRIVDLGTKFAVRQDSERLEVSLIEGRARFETTNGLLQAHASILSPGDVIVATGNTISLARKPIPRLEASLGWRRDVLIFDHTTLADAANEFNRYNGEKLVIADSNAAARIIGGTFPKNGLADFADVAKGLLKLRVSKIGNKIVISR